MIKRRGVAQMEVLASGLAVLVLACMCFAFIQSSSQASRENADGHKQTNICRAMMIFSETEDGRFPVPGMALRQPVSQADGTSQRIPGRGKPDWSRNTTANLFSFMIMQNLLGVDDVVSPLEVSHLVKVIEDYDFDSYSPFGENPTMWDSAFHADPGNVTVTSNASYANQALCGARLIKHWGSGSSRHPTSRPLLSLRGPREGVTSGPDFLRSPTLRFMGSPDQWSSWVLFADGHVARRDTPDIANARGEQEDIFSGGDPAGESPWLGVFLIASQNDSTPGWDPLLPETAVPPVRPATDDSKVIPPQPE